jgi:D-alanyl-D-alanine-carboxypeptidase/D-alanyl-D-alanine-endopeptidase
MPHAVPAQLHAIPSNDEIRRLLARRTKVAESPFATVVGIVTPEGTRVISHGECDGDTVFEIGTLTKIFTALLLADAAQRGEVTLTDPVAKYLPHGTKMPPVRGRAIELLDLATHTSGLPLWPPEVNTEREMYGFLAAYELPRETGSQWEYSNIGFALLGHALTLRAGMDYQSLVRSRICIPLKLKHTSIAAGHDAGRKPSPEWSIPPFAAGAGSLRSTAQDLLRLLAAFIGLEDAPLAPAMAAMFDTRRPGPRMEQAVGWWLMSLPGGAPIITHRGHSAGFFSNVAYDFETRTGVVLLSNSSADDGGITWHLLRPAFPIQ